MTAVARLQALVTRKLGLDLGGTRAVALESLLRRRTEATGLSVERWLAELEAARSGSEELRALARELTVGESSFFRHLDQLRGFAEGAVPEVLAARPGPLRVLSAGCASGEEPATLVMLLRDAPRMAGRELLVRAVDVNPAALERARRGRYSPWALRDTPSEVRGRWFSRDGRDFVLDPVIRDAITYEERNLVEDDSDLWAPGSFDVVFCRNVIMYFPAEVQRRVVERIARSLAPGGFLFLGHAETLRGLSHDFHLRHTHGAFHYQRRDGGPRPPVPPLPRPLPVDLSWVEAIHHASDRIQRLARPAVRTAPVPGPRAPMAELGRAIALLGEERHQEARQLLDSLPPEAARDPDALLIRAVLLTHGGGLAEAERACREILEVDELSAGAHYVMALCREGAGDRAGAAEHDEVAVYLDPAFAMPRLHLGLLARRAGDRETARRQLGEAALLLEREDTSRILLFGGGFGRESLLALCQAEIAACGSAP